LPFITTIDRKLKKYGINKKIELILDWEDANHPLKSIEKFRLMKLSKEELEEELHKMAIKSQEDRF